MKQLTNKSFVLIHSVVYTAFAAGLFFIPKLLWPNYGLQLNDQYAVFLSQHTSIFLSGIAIIGFLFYDVEEKSHYAKKLFLAFLMTNLLGVIITLYACLQGIFHGLGWSDPAFFALLSILSYLKWMGNK